MPNTDNNGSVHYTKNAGQSQIQTITNTFTKLSAFVGSEVTIINRGLVTIHLYDNNQFNDTNSLILSANESYVFRGIANTDQLSAKTQAGTGTLNYRSQRFSMLGL